MYVCNNCHTPLADNVCQECLERTGDGSTRYEPRYSVYIPTCPEPWVPVVLFRDSTHEEMQWDREEFFELFPNFDGSPEAVAEVVRWHHD